MNEALEKPDSTDKLDRIRAIHSAGFGVTHKVLRHGLTEKEAFEVESALIDFVGLPQLTNRVAGYHAEQRGIKTVDELFIQYDAREATINEPSVLITINKLYRVDMTDEELYMATRGDWVIGIRRNKIAYAFAVYRGIVRQVYQIQNWEQIHHPDYTRKRWRFSGEVAQDLQHYVGTSVAHYINQGAQNPIKYLNC